MRRFVLTAQARLDLLDIWHYIAQHSIEAAERITEEFYDAMSKLGEVPGMGHTRTDLTEQDVRFWRVQSYLIVYRADKLPIEIVRVLSGYRDIAALLD